MERVCHVGDRRCVPIGHCLIVVVTVHKHAVHGCYVRYIPVANVLIECELVVKEFFHVSHPWTNAPIVDLSISLRHGRPEHFISTSPIVDSLLENCFAIEARGE